MKALIVLTILCLFAPLSCVSYKILAIFPYNGRSHHILFSALVEELASRNHDVTVINYFPVKKMANLRQISIQDETGAHCDINMEDNLKSIPASPFVDFYRAYDMASAFQIMANDNCKRVMNNDAIRKLTTSGDKYDLVIVEQFVTDCGLAIAYKLNAPTVGITAHILMPWTYSRLGAPNNPSFVPNHLFATGSKPSVLKKIQSMIINLAMNAYFTYFIQRSDQEIVNIIYPDVPDLESLGRNISLVMLNQYFPLTGSRLYGANVIEVGGMHIKQDNHIVDKELQSFLDSAKNGVVYISFGTVASNFPSETLDEIIAFIQNSKMNFIWKVDKIADDAANNLLTRKWLPQPAILCHPNVVAFVTHSGMLSTSEAMHCGVPIVGVPLFGDQFSNADSAMENGLGVVVDIYTLNRKVLEDSLQTVLQARYQKRAKELSKLWMDRPISAMDTAVFWIEYAARHQGRINMKPAAVYINIFEYLLLDVLLIFVLAMMITWFAINYVIRLNFCLYKKERKDLPRKIIRLYFHDLYLLYLETPCSCNTFIIIGCYLLCYQLTSGR